MFCNIFVTKMFVLGDKLRLTGAGSGKRAVSKCGLAGKLNIASLMGGRNAEEQESKKELAVNISPILTKIDANRGRSVRSSVCRFVA